MYATSTAKQGRVTHWQRCVDLAHLDSGPPTVIPTSLCRLPLFDEQFFKNYFTLVVRDENYITSTLKNAVLEAEMVVKW